MKNAMIIAISNKQIENKIFLLNEIEHFFELKVIRQTQAIPSLIQIATEDAFGMNSLQVTDIISKRLVAIKEAIEIIKQRLWKVRRCFDKSQLEAINYSLEHKIKHTTFSVLDLLKIMVLKRYSHFQLFDLMNIIFEKMIEMKTQAKIIINQVKKLSPTL